MHGDQGMRKTRRASAVLSFHLLSLTPYFLFLSLSLSPPLRFSLSFPLTSWEMTVASFLLTLYYTIVKPLLSIYYVPAFNFKSM